ncbi:MAG: aminoglycoside phosphotransferase family protein [Eubacteriales bacterium]|nr:aminoglycoside phosphotransferase family protein [Eubacteriales bacterium]
MAHLFTQTIAGWQSWGEVFQSIPAFTPLTEHIFAREGLPCGEISQLTPGSNAVFRVGRYVVKIFAPAQSGVDTAGDYLREMLGMRRAMELGIHIPHLVAASQLQDNYLFRYLIMDYIDAADAKDVLGGYTPAQKLDFVGRLRADVDKLHAPLAGFPVQDVRQRALENPRWDVLPAAVVAQLRRLVQAHVPAAQVYVHGDITGENVLICADGMLHLIDFADGRIAPAGYELPPILFDLMDFDPLMVRAYLSGDAAQAADDCFWGLLLHEFGAYFVQLICRRLLGINPDELTDLMQIQAALEKFFAG